MNADEPLVDGEGSSRIKALLTVPGCKVEPYVGEDVSFQPIILNDVDGFEAEMCAVTDWPPGVTADRAGVVALGVVDLVLRWPLGRIWLSLENNGQEVSQAPDISRWEPYEWLETLMAGYRPPGSVATISNDAQRRIGQLWRAAMDAPAPILDLLLGPFALASSAANATNPYDRVMSLWSGIELLYPVKGEMNRLETILTRDPSFADVEDPRGAKHCGQLLSYRSELARDQWLHAPVRAALQTEPSTAFERVKVATVVAYAIRCKIVHGQWARTRNDRRIEAGAAERWLWQLIEREVECRLTGGRLPPIRAITSTLFGNLSRASQDLRRELTPHAPPS
jgi:hypothetical protein